MSNMHSFFLTLSLAASALFAQEVATPPSDGPFVQQHANGKPSVKENYKAGKLDGLRQTFDEKGGILTSETYRAGLKNGAATLYKDAKAVTQQTWLDGFLAYPQSKANIKASFSAIKSLKINDQGLGGDQVSALRRLMMARSLAMVPWQTLTLDKDWARKCHLGAHSNEILGHLEHYPKNVPGLSEADMKDAAEACGTSNLHMNSGGKCYPLAQCVDGWLEDDGDNNKERVGHRRWCLSQTLGATAFGVSGGYSAMWCFDKSGDLQNYAATDAISWPVHGYHSKDFTPPDLLWHVTLNPDKFKAPVDGKVKVNIRPISGTLSNIERAMKTSPLELDWLHVDNSGIGMWRNAIVFRPKKFSPKGTCLVEVTGLLDSAGKDSSYKYLVEFF